MEFVREYVGDGGFSTSDSGLCQPACCVKIILIKVDVYEVQDRHHFDIVLDMNDMSAEVTQALVRQILSA